MLSGDWVASLDGLGGWNPLFPDALIALERSAELNMNGGQMFLEARASSSHTGSWENFCGRKRGCGPLPQTSSPPHAPTTSDLCLLPQSSVSCVS